MAQELVRNGVSVQANSVFMININCVKKMVLITLLTSSMIMSGCSNLSTRQKNAAAGAAIGGVAGAVLTGGSAFGTVGGAAIGGVIGHGVDGLTSKKK